MPSVTTNFHLSAMTHRIIDSHDTPVEIDLTVAYLDEVLAALCEGVQFGEDGGDVQHPALLRVVVVHAGRLPGGGGGGGCEGRLDEEFG